jgi:hypothetical protein
MLWAMIHTALDALLYARTVNGIRAFFADRGAELGVDISPYLVMPTEKDRPKYFHIRGFFWLVVLVSIVNATYIALPSFVLWLQAWASILLGVGLIISQFAMYYVFCRIRQKKEIPE